MSLFLAIGLHGQNPLFANEKRHQPDYLGHWKDGISRNPINVFIDLYFIGTFLLNGTLFFLLSALAVVAGLHYQILQEEQFLTRQYGQAYQDYQARTKRYFGRKI